MDGRGLGGGLSKTQKIIGDVSKNAPLGTANIVQWDTPLGHCTICTVPKGGEVPM